MSELIPGDPKEFIPKELFRGNFTRRAGWKRTVYLSLLFIIAIMAIYSFATGAINFWGLIVFFIGGIAFFLLNYQEARIDITTSANRMMKQAESSARDMHWKSAISYFNETLVYEPESLPAQMGIGYCYKELKNYQDASVEYEKAVNLDPESSDAHLMLGVCLYETGNLDKSKETLMRAVKLRPNFIEANMMLGDIFKYFGEEDKALECYEKCFEKARSEKVRSILREKLKALKHVTPSVDLGKIKEDKKEGPVFEIPGVTLIEKSKHEAIAQEDFEAFDKTDQELDKLLTMMLEKLHGEGKHSIETGPEPSSAIEILSPDVIAGKAQADEKPVVHSIETLTAVAPEDLSKEEISEKVEPESAIQPVENIAVIAPGDLDDNTQAGEKQEQTQQPVLTESIRALSPDDLKED